LVIRKYDKNYYEKNKERFSKNWKRHYQKNKEKIRERQKEYYLKNKKTILEYHRNYRIKNKEKLREYWKKKRTENPEKFKKKSKKYYLQNSEQILEKLKAQRKISGYGKKYYRQNRAQELKRNKDYKKTPSGKLSQRWTTIKGWTLKRKGEFNLTKKELKEIFLRDKVCVYCQADKSLQIDHVVPLPKGATVKTNLVVACETCNKSKMKKDVFAWCRERGFQIPEVISYG